MALLSLLLFITLAVAVVIAERSAARKRAQTDSNSSRLPGPKGLPLIGNVHELPAKCSWIKFHEWSLEYGPIYQVNLAGTNHVWIARDKIAHDLLSKRASIYSDRPFIPALQHDNRTSGQYLPLMSCNEKWTRQRKFAKHIMDRSKKGSFDSYARLESVRLLFEMMTRPESYNEAMESFVARVTSRLAWGTPAPAEELKQRARELLISVSPAGALGNKVPFLMSLPERLVKAKAWELKRGRTERRFFEIMQDEVRTTLRTGINTASSLLAATQSKESWTRMFLENQDAWGFESDLEGAYAVGMHAIAGALTIAAPMQSFCLAMCHYPQYQSILHEEIDRVLGDRMPTFQDMPSMPVLRAFIRETLRWRPPVPTGIPHELVQDDVYEGFFIPKGSVIHPLEWSISRDPDFFPQPDDWNPLRWLDSGFPTYQEPLTRYPTITQYSQFGYGHRVCQGQDVTEADLFVGLGSVAWLFSMHIDGEAKAEPSEGAGRVPALSRESFASSVGMTRFGNEGNDHVSLASGDDGKDDECHVEAMRSDSAVGLSERTSMSMKHEEVLSGEANSSQDVMPKPAVESSNDVDVENFSLDIPGRWVTASEEVEKTSKLPADTGTDATMHFSTLLIAKPMPFKFRLEIRNPARAEKVARQWIQRRIEGEYEEPRVFWPNNNQGDANLGWGEVFA